MMFDKLIQRYLAENTTDELKLVPTLSGAKALLARIFSGRPEGFSPSERTDQLQLVREGSLLNFSKISIASVGWGMGIIMCLLPILKDCR
jgi:hypothetical protein